MNGVSIDISPVSMTVSTGTDEVSVSTGTPVVKEYEERKPYEGAYEVTPGGSVQILETKNLRMTGDITVNPVPSNYGLITWNGAFLTVS